MHFRVAVFTKEEDDDGLIEELMAPYYEGLKMEPYLSKTHEEALEIINNIRNKRGIVLTEDAFQEFIKLSDDEAIKKWFGENCVDDKGNVYSTYNPDSKWDYYGEVTVIRPSKLDNEAKHDLFPYAYITLDGVWHAPGEIGWFSSSETADEWKEHQKALRGYCKNNPNLWIHWLDCHI